MPDFLLWQWFAIGFIFIWTGFVRTGIGFGGAALGLPLLLLVDANPLVFIPLIGLHLIFFTSLTLSQRIHHVNWQVVRNVLLIMLIPKLAGVIGLLSLPPVWMTLVVYVITLVYGVLWLLHIEVKSQHRWVDLVLLIMGGYISGASLIGAPLIVAVVIRYVARDQLRETLFVLWFVLVLIKLAALQVADVDFHWLLAAALIPLAAIGHFIGLRFHDRIVQAGDGKFRQVIGAGLAVVSIIGLLKVLV
jgi:uncharacterized membrane protein YfcA